MAGDRPHILLIHSHDLGRRLGCYGVATIQSPNLDALASTGVRFDRAFCTAPQCSPSRASLVTGRYPHSNGVMGLCQNWLGWDLHPDEQHIGQVLRAGGFSTVLIGVHHETLEGTPEQVAERCGMDEVFLGGRGQAVSERALGWLRRYAAAKPTRPFFMELGYVEPHRMPARERVEPDYMGFLGDYIQPDAERGVTIPSYLRDEPRARAELAEHQGAIRYVDAAIGAVLDEVAELGLEENTLVLFTTDHGAALPRAKCSLYEPGLEAALIARLPSRGWHGGRVYSQLVSNVDIFPTLLDLVGIPVSASVHGRSLLRILDGEDDEGRDAVFGELTYHGYYDPRRSVRTARHKLIVNFSAAQAFLDPTQSWRPRTCSVVPAAPRNAFHPTIELYDLSVDPTEWTNLADDPAHEEVRQDLLARLYRWMRETGDPLLDGAIAAPSHHWAISALTTAGRGGRLSGPINRTPPS